MSFNDIFANIFTVLTSDATLVPGILGPKVPGNMRIYRASPQVQSMLTTYEPNQPAEGWIVIEEVMPYLRLSHQQAQTNHEYVQLTFHVYATTYGVAHAVVDYLDRLWHWEIPQQRDVQWGERWLLFTRRGHELDKYDQQTKLFEKQIGYSMEFVREEALSDA